MGQKVYFIQMGEKGPIKIGQSANPELRLASLQTANPAALNLLWVYEGDEYTEQNIHGIFKKDRIRGEWFKPSEELTTFIEDYLQNDYEIKIFSGDQELSVNHGMGYGFIFHLGTMAIEVCNNKIHIENFDGQTINIKSNDGGRPFIEIISLKK